MLRRLAYSNLYDDFFVCLKFLISVSMTSFISSNELSYSHMYISKMMIAEMKIRIFFLKFKDLFLILFFLLLNTEAFLVNKYILCYCILKASPPHKSLSCLFVNNFSFKTCKQGVKISLNNVVLCVQMGVFWPEILLFIVKSLKVRNFRL